MTKPLRNGTWDYTSALQTVVREMYRSLSINQNPDRDEDCLFMGQIAWEATFAIKMKRGDDPHDAMFVLLEDQEPDEELRRSLLQRWDEDVEDIRILDDDLDEGTSDDDDDDDPKVNRYGPWLAELRQQMQAKFSYADETERKSS